MKIEFKSVVTSKSSDNQMIAILGLIKPIPEVVGSTGVTMKDVTEIKCHESMFNNPDNMDHFNWDEDKEIGKYEGNLVLDVNKPSRAPGSVSAVWLTDIPFKERMMASIKPQSEINKEKFDKFIDGLKQ